MPNTNAIRNSEKEVAWSVCGLRDLETEETCKKECEFYHGSGKCSEEYDITLTFCPYQNRKNGSMEVPESLGF